MADVPVSITVFSVRSSICQRAARIIRRLLEPVVHGSNREKDNLSEAVPQEPLSGSAAVKKAATEEEAMEQAV